MIVSSSTPEQVSALQKKHGRDAAGHAIEQAQSENAAMLLVRINTPGGLLDATRQIIQKLDAGAAKRDAEDEGIALLPKPYTLRDLAAHLTSALSTPRA